MDFFEQQDRARKKTKLLVFYFILAVLMIIIALNLVAFFALKLSSAQHAELDIIQWFNLSWFYYTTLGTLAMISLGSLFRWLQLRDGGRSVAQMVNGREVLPDTNDSLERRFINVVEEMSIASGTPMPSLYIMDDEDAINAFVAGYETSNTVMVITRGALENLDRQELQAVVAHEFSHIFNADMNINLKLISTLAGILLLGQIGSFILRSLRHSRVRSSSNKDSGGAVLVVMMIGVSMFVVGSIGLFFGRLIKAAISRQREFLADASAVQYARDNEGLAGAFIKINHQGSILRTRHAEDTSHMCISEPIQISFNGLASHPPMEQRLDAVMPNWKHYKNDIIRAISKKQQQELQQRQEAAKLKDQKIQTSKQAFTGLIDTVGKPTARHLQVASALLLALPTELKQAVHGHHGESHPIYLVFALLLSDHGQIDESSLQLIEDTYGKNSGQQVLNLASHFDKDKAHQRLALLDIALPSLRRLSEKDRIQFFKLLKTIIHQDHYVSQFEYVLYSLLRKNINPSARSHAKEIKQFELVLPEIQIILSAMVHASNQTKDNNRSCFQTLWLNFSSHEKGLLENNFKAEKFHKAITVLTALTPSLKKTLLTVLEQAATHDGIIQASEAELLRAIAECLNCPIPPLLEPALA